MRTFFALSLCVVATTLGCNSNSDCPTESTSYLSYDGSVVLRTNGTAGSTAMLDLSMPLDTSFALPSDPVSSLGTGDELPAAPDTDSVQVAVNGTPGPVFTVLESKPIVALDGTELTVGQSFDSMGTVTLTRWDLPDDANGFPRVDTTPITYHFTIASYAAPDLPSNLSTDDWKTKPFLVVDFTTDTATTELGTFATSGQAGYYLERITSHTDCHPSTCDGLFSCN